MFNTGFLIGRHEHVSICKIVFVYSFTFIALLVEVMRRVISSFATNFKQVCSQFSAMYHLIINAFYHTAKYI